MKNENSQSGNALWFILIAIVLLGGLNVMLTRSSSNSNDTGSHERFTIQANEILNYAKSLETAVQNLRARGCSENELSFENSFLSGASYTGLINSPTNESCHIFEPAGAGMTYTSPNKDWLDSSEISGFNYGEYQFSSVNRVVNLGNNVDDDLLIFLSWIKKPLCEAINQQLFNDTSIVQDTASFSYAYRASGEFDVATAGLTFTSSATQDGQPTGCFTSQNEGGYHFYHALLTR